jgi:TPR repeat protein
MNSLGRRYESGHGTPRNEDQAIRCYVKAARLGNAHAASRLAARGIAVE